MCAVIAAFSAKSENNPGILLARLKGISTEKKKEEMRRGEGKWKGRKRT